MEGVLAHRRRCCLPVLLADLEQLVRTDEADSQLEYSCAVSAERFAAGLPPVGAVALVLVDREIGNSEQRSPHQSVSTVASEALRSSPKGTARRKSEVRLSDYCSGGIE